MSGYWDAVLGAALGLPGTARPPQPPAFAAEDGLAPLEIEELVDAPAGGEAASTAVRSPPMAAGRSEAEPASAPAFPAPVAAALPAAALPAPLPAAALPASVPGAESESPATEAAPVRPAAPAPAEPVAEPPRTEPTFVEAREPVAASAPGREERTSPERRVAVTEVEALRPAEGLSAVPATPAAPPGTAEPAAPAAAAEPILVAAEPLPAPAVAMEESHGASELPPLTIEIGRIDVRILPPEPAPAVPASGARPLPETVPSLADYLARRSEAGR